jgi:nicotinate phosphoribosyltransferase
MTASSTALYTDQYELTMLDAARRSGTADNRVTFEVFARKLPDGRKHGVFCGLGRLVDAIERFTFGPDELDWLARRRIVSDDTLDWLAEYRFSGNVYTYREGEIYAADSPVVTVEGTFGETVLLETIVLSILNHDSAVAAAAERLVAAAAGRPIIEMGSRRVDADAAVAAARAAWIAGFASTSNLEAGRRYGIPTAGTAAHAFTLASPDERAAFASQIAAQGTDTTLLVDTYDSEQGIRNAVDVAGLALGAIRIDSGDLVEEARRARKLLDGWGASSTRVVITGDLDEAELADLADAPVDGYGVGTAVVTGGGAPTAGLIYKLVAAGERPVAKLSPGKATRAGRKWAWRLLDQSGGAVGEEVATVPEPPAQPARALQVDVIRDGAVVHRPSLEEVRAHHRAAVAELPADGALPLRFRETMPGEQE